jgi:prepilin-type N-terminal cleavage/methylation domain-containing protein
MKPTNPTSPATNAAPRGFTLIELLIAVSIIVLASVLLLPGFTKLLESTNYSSAINLTTSALGQARSLAIRNNRYAGVMFSFDYATETCTIQVIELLSAGGTGYLTSSVAFQTDGAYCQPFRPAAGQAPIELPRGFCIYGLSYAVTRTRNPDGTTIPSGSSRSPVLDNGTNGSGPTYQWYAGEIAEEGVAQTTAGAGEAQLWLPPRTDPSLYMPDGTNPWAKPRASWAANERTAVRHAQSFAIFFDPAGSVVSATSQGGTALQNAYLEFGDAPYDLSPPAPGPRVILDRANTFDPEYASNNATNPTPNPEVRLRSATSLAIVDLARLGRDIQLPKPWLARTGTASSTTPPRRTDLEGITANGVTNAYFSNVMIKRISAWIDRNAEVLTFNRVTGNVNRRAGS